MKSEMKKLTLTTMNTVFTITILICMMLMTSIAWSAIIRVPGDQPTIQAGIDAAVDGDTVLIADGTYTGAGNRDLDFKGKVIIVTSENGARNCIIDCENDGRGFYFQSGETESSVISGFTIKNGYETVGGGIYCYDSSPTITKNNIEGNFAEYYGGGIACDSSSPTIINNVILGNVTDSDGGGIYCYDSFSTITNNIIKENVAEYWAGGGIACYSSSDTITNNTIEGNSGVLGVWGGGIYCDGSSTITNNIIFGNSTGTFGAGGGIFCDGSITITQNIIKENECEWGGGIFCDGSPIITNNAILGNGTSETGGGGGVFCDRSSSPTIINNTICGNSAYAGSYEGGGIYFEECSATIINTTLWNNSPDEILLDESSITVTYSDIQGGWPGEGNIDADPLFVLPESYDYHLQAGSPCIDAGTPSGAPPDDIEGNPRDEFPDMGAYEYQGVGTISIEIISPVDGDEFSVGSLVDVVVEVRDEFGEPMAGVEVAFTATGGAVEPTTVVTDENGQAVSQLTVAEGENTVTATLTEYPDIFDTVTVIGVVGTGSINGTVTDLVGFPVGALVIAVKESVKKSTLTELPNGYYEILALEPGTYWVICIKKGYKLGIRQAEVVAGGETTVDFKLRRKQE